VSRTPPPEEARRRVKAAAAADPIDITDEPDAVKGITEAIDRGAIPHIFLRGRQLVQIAARDGDLQIRDLDPDILRGLISDWLPCTRKVGPQQVAHPALPYPVTCRAILARADWPKVPRLRGVVFFPVLLADGTVLQDSGYHQASGLYLHGGGDIKPLDASPSAQDVAAARAFLLGRYLGDFPWVSDADLANYLAVLLTPLLREIIAGLFPFAVITAPERGSGKTLLALFFEILYGASMRTLPKDDAEMRKSITAALRGAHPVIIFDNIPEYSTITAPSLAAAVTLPTWTDRILGQSREGTWPNDRLWCATGTNVRVGGDFAQRTVLIRIDFGRPRPDLRGGFAIQNIDQWTAANRGEVIRALLVLAADWYNAGAPRSGHVMRGFTRWAQVLGGVLAHHRIPGFLENREEIVAHDEDAETWGHFLAVWRGQYGEIAQTARAVLTDAATRPELRDALPSTRDGGPHTSRTLGNALAAHEGRWHGDLAVKRVGGAQRSVLWRVVKHVPDAGPTLYQEGTDQLSKLTKLT
jgi:hypothetical protein